MFDNNRGEEKEGEKVWFVLAYLFNGISILYGLFNAEIWFIFSVLLPVSVWAHKKITYKYIHP